MSIDHHHDEQGDKLLESEDFQKARREMRQTLWQPGVQADQNVGITPPGPDQPGRARRCRSRGDGRLAAPH